MRRKTYCPFPRLLLLRQRPSSCVQKTEGKVSKKEHAEQEANPILLALMSWHAILSLSIAAIFFLLLLHNSGKLSITHDHLFLLLHIMHLILSKSLQRQGEISISGRADMPFFRTDFLQPIFDRQFRKFVLLVLQQCREDCVVIGGRSKPFFDRWTYMDIFLSVEILGCAIDLVDGQMVRNVNVNIYLCFRLSCELVG